MLTNVVYALKQKVLRGRRSGLCEEMGLQPISELFTTDFRSAGVQSGSSLFENIIMAWV